MTSFISHSIAEKPVHGLHEFCRAFFLRCVPAIRNNHQFGVLEFFRQLDRMLGWYDAVVIAGDQQDRDLKAGKLLSDFRWVACQVNFPKAAVPVLGLQRPGIAVPNFRANF